MRNEKIVKIKHPEGTPKDFPWFPTDEIKSIDYPLLYELYGGLGFTKGEKLFLVGIAVLVIVGLTAILW